MTVANQITLARIFLVPVFIGLIVHYARTGNEAYRVAALSAFAAASVGDAIDGFVARHFNQRSNLGAVLDPLADKLLLTAAMVVLTLGSHTYLPPWPAWLLALALARDVIILAGLALVRHRAGGVKVRAHISGKIATALQMITVVWMMLRWDGRALGPLEIGAGIFTGLACGFYIRDGVRQFYSYRPVP